MYVVHVKSFLTTLARFARRETLVSDRGENRKLSIEQSLGTVRVHSSDLCSRRAMHEMTGVQARLENKDDPILNRTTESGSINSSFVEW